MAALQQTHYLSPKSTINTNPNKQQESTRLKGIVSFPVRSGQMGAIRAVNKSGGGGGGSSSSSSSSSTGSSNSSSSSSGAPTGTGGAGGDQKVPNSNYVVPLDKAASGITRPLAEILRDLNKRVPDNVLKPFSKIVPWYHANRMLSFYAPGWCGDVRDVIFSDSGSVTVVYRVTIRGSDGEAYRESMGTVMCTDSNAVDAIAAAEELAFVKACARFGLGLYLYHEE